MVLSVKEINGVKIPAIIVAKIIVRPDCMSVPLFAPCRHTMHPFLYRLHCAVQSIHAACVFCLHVGTTIALTSNVSKQHGHCIYLRVLSMGVSTYHIV